FGHFLAVLVVAAGVGFYHWRVLRADAAARPAKPAAAPVARVALASTAVPAAAATAPETLGPHARRYTLVVTDATDDDVHQALAMLPPQAGYHLTATEQTVDGRRGAGVPRPGRLAAPRRRPLPHHRSRHGGQISTGPRPALP